MAIHFGTDGWRAVIAEEFTFANVRRVAAAIGNALRSVGPAGADSRPVVVGYDTRFLSRQFATAAAETLLGAGNSVLMSDDACPTPASSCQVVASSSPYAVVITASHNPARFNGIKIKDSTGASAGQEITSAVERQLVDRDPPRTTISEGRANGRFRQVSFSTAHRDRLARMVDLPAIRSAGFKVAVDPMNGACGRLLETMLMGSSTKVVTIHADPDPLFGGRHPEPVEQNLEELGRLVPEGRFDAGLATDGDGDRIGAFDERGEFVSPLRIAPLLALSLIKKGRRGPIGKTFANTLLLDRIARRYDLPFSTFPVGFKYIAAEMQAGRMLLGGEESGGIGVEGFIPERDGTLVSLMLLEAMVESGKTLSQMVTEMTREFGELHYKRRDLPCSSEEGRRLVERVRSSPPQTIGGMRVTGLDDLDGVKLLFGDDGWLLLRASGTEPVLRVYSEAPTKELLEAVMSDAAALVSPR